MEAALQFFNHCKAFTCDFAATYVYTHFSAVVWGLCYYTGLSAGATTVAIFWTLAMWSIACTTPLLYDWAFMKPMKKLCIGIDNVNRKYKNVE